VDELRPRSAAIVEVSRADHALEVAGDLQATLGALAAVTDEIASFVGRL
jgi:hypothetical protein